MGKQKNYKTGMPLIAAICAAAIAVCAPKAVTVDFSNVPDNEICQYMKDVCREAERFHAQFQQMNREEREDAKAILGAFAEQCEGAQELCRQTME
ncbi:MAG: hypothetical protein LBU70_06125 [Chitinispirillales bacterium]|jgi:hypothetical protein|nr:hypothetical protein [Chitinispirillales bacterium]